MYTSLMVLLFVFASANGDGHEDCDLSPISNCPFYNFQSDKVTPQQMIDQDVMGEHWLMIYYSDFNAHQSYGKCNFRWNIPGQDGVVNRELVCYNSDTKSCEDFKRTVTRKVDSCGRVEENAVSGTMDAKFYSQDLSQYFWYDCCDNYTESGDCELRYLDLLVRVSRYTECGFDGKIINGVEEQRASFIGILCVMAISLLF